MGWGMAQAKGEQKKQAVAGFLCQQRGFHWFVVPGCAPANALLTEKGFQFPFEELECMIARVC